MHAFVCAHMYLVVCMPQCTCGSQRTTYKVSSLLQLCEFQVSLSMVWLGSRCRYTVRWFSQVYCYSISSAQGWLLQRGPWSQPLFHCVTWSSHSSGSQISRLAGSCNNVNTSAAVCHRRCCAALHGCTAREMLCGTWPAVWHMSCWEAYELLCGTWAAVFHVSCWAA